MLPWAPDLKAGNAGLGDSAAGRALVLQVQFPEPKEKRQMRCSLLIANSSSEEVEPRGYLGCPNWSPSLLCEFLAGEIPLFKKQSEQDLMNDT